VVEDVTVARFPDGSLVVAARVSTSDGKVGERVARIRRGHPQYEAWRSYCERHPENVVERPEQRVRVGESVETGLVFAVASTGVITLWSVLLGDFDGMALGSAVTIGAVIFGFWFMVGFVGSEWSRYRDQEPSRDRRPSQAEVEPPLRMSGRAVGHT
jgi:hypothetical protein